MSSSLNVNLSKAPQTPGGRHDRTLGFAHMSARDRSHSSKTGLVSLSWLVDIIPTALDNDRCHWSRRRPPLRAHAREAKGADAPARRLRAALMSHHQGPMVSVPFPVAQKQCLSQYKTR